MPKKDDVVFIYDENGEKMEDIILKIFEKYLEETFK